MHRDPDTAPASVLLTNHGQVLLAVAENPDARIREIAERVGITERATQSILNDLVEVGYVERIRVGRRNTYTVDESKPFQHPALRQGRVGSLLGGLTQWSPAEQSPADAADQGLDGLTTLAGSLLHAPIAFVSMICEQMETITNGIGIPAELVGRELPLDASLCRHVVASQEPVVVSDAADDPRTRDNAAVTRYGLRAYAGIALRRSDGSAIGSLCVADTRPRRWTKTDIRMLTSVAVAAASQVEISAVSRRHHDAAERYRMLLDSLPETLILVFDRDLRLQVASGAALTRNGYQPGEMIGRLLEDFVPSDRAAHVRPHYEKGLAGIRHEFVNDAQDGVTYTIDVVPLPGPDGEITAVMAVGREPPTDQTARRHAA